MTASLWIASKGPLEGPGAYLSKRKHAYLYGRMGDVDFAGSESART
jgi:hypothetical protein